MRYIIILAFACLLSSCLKKDGEILDYRGIDALVVNPKSNFPSKSVFATRATDSAFGVTKLNLLAKYSFQTPAPRDIKVTFTRDEDMITKYNQTFGNTYVPLPVDFYQMPSAEAVIRAGSQEGVLHINLDPSKISGNNNYIIAFSISSADGVNIAQNFKSIVYTLKGK